MDPSMLLVSELSKSALEMILEYIVNYSQKMNAGDVEIPVGDQKLNYSKVVGKYITCNQGFGDELLSLRDAIKMYSGRIHPKRSFNVFIGATSGSGKSYLVKQLAEELGEKTVSYLEYQVAAFQTVEDLYDVFRMVQSENLKGKLPFILLDCAIR